MYFILEAVFSCSKQSERLIHTAWELDSYLIVCFVAVAKFAWTKRASTSLSFQQRSREPYMQPNLEIITRNLPCPFDSTYFMPEFPGRR
jgi:hypothetical protein